VTSSVAHHVSQIDLLRLMIRIRYFEDRCEALFREVAIAGAMHLYSGQEAVAVGVCSAMASEDALSFTYRSHGWALARGMSVQEVFAECMGRASGVELPNRPTDICISPLKSYLVSSTIGIARGNRARSQSRVRASRTSASIWRSVSYARCAWSWPEVEPYTALNNQIEMKEKVDRAE